MAEELQKYPPMVNNNVLMAIKESQPPQIPVWIMRQTGKYLPEYRQLCNTHGFLKICRDPELAKRATLMPMERFDFDAAMVFSDILNVPYALGMEVIMAPKPIFPDRLELCDLPSLQTEGAVARLGYVGETISMVRRELNGTATVFGFSGAPWTLMSYMVEGGSSMKYSDSKKWLYMYKPQAHQLLNILTDVVADFCIMQAKAGAQVIQLYDHHAKYLDRSTYTEFCLPGLTAIREKVRAGLEPYQLDVPMSIYTRPGRFLRELSEAGYELISLDYTTDPDQARSELANMNVCLQGNLDPSALYGDVQGLRRRVNTMLKKFRGSRVIANLGEAISKDVPLENVQAFVDTVRSYKL